MSSLFLQKIFLVYFTSCKFHEESVCYCFYFLFLFHIGVYKLYLRNRNEVQQVLEKERTLQIKIRYWKTLMNNLTDEKKNMFHRIELKLVIRS